jgi:hypothetical protein
MDLTDQYETARERLRHYQRSYPRGHDKVLQAEFEVEMLRGGIENLRLLIEEELASKKGDRR